MAAGREIERKFLVSAIPDNRGPGTRILQGYLPLASEDTESAYAGRATRRS